MRDYQAEMDEAVEKINELIPKFTKSLEMSLNFGEQKKNLLAQYVLQQEGKSLSEREMKARLLPEWKEFCQQQARAESLTTMYKAYLKKWEIKFEALRSLMSLEKSQMNLT